MIRQLRILPALGVTAALLSTPTVERATAVTYKATIITPVGYDSADAVGISGTSIVGLGNPSSGEGGAFLLNSATNIVAELNPVGWVAQPNDVSGDSQVGHGYGPTTSGNTHALLWQGTAASLVDLNPAGFDSTFALGISGNNQVGFGAGTATGGPFHALVWHGSAESVTDFHSNEFIASYAYGVYEDSVVGLGTNAQGKDRALLWHGTAESIVNLHPAPFPESFAEDVSQDSQVGTGIISATVNGERHALLWHGTAESVIDLHSSGFIQTGATGVAGIYQVGYGRGTTTDGQQHALLWSGSAASVVNLHALLAGLGPSFVGSYAYDIDANGVIVGSASDGNIAYAVKWSPVPEPSSLAICGVGLIIAAAVRQRKTRDKRR